MGTFASNPTMFGAFDEFHYVSGSGLILTPSEGGAYRTYTGMQIENLDVCVDIRRVDAADGNAGIMFWRLDKSNYNGPTISAGGTA